MKQQQHHILFSVAGMTPAVITETLFGLWQQGVRGGEIHVLTTSYGRRRMQVLLEEDGQVAAFNRAYQCQWRACYEWIEAITADASISAVQLGHGPMPLDDLRYNSSGRGQKDGPSRWVDIDPARLRVIE